MSRTRCTRQLELQYLKVPPQLYPTPGAPVPHMSRPWCTLQIKLQNRRYPASDIADKCSYNAPKCRAPDITDNRSLMPLKGEDLYFLVVFFGNHTKNTKMNIRTKNSAYWRHWFPQHVRIVAQTHFFYQGMCVMFMCHVSDLMCHMSHLMCHVKIVTCNVSHVVCHLSHESNANSHIHWPFPW